MLLISSRQDCEGTQLVKNVFEGTRDNEDGPNWFGQAAGEPWREMDAIGCCSS